MAALAHALTIDRIADIQSPMPVDGVCLSNADRYPGHPRWPAGLKRYLKLTLIEPE